MTIRDRIPVAPGSVLLGVGLGGFVDGIVLHQILQWHHLLSHTDRYGDGSLADLEANTIADGVFHAGAWVFVVAGVVVMWRHRTAARHRSLTGGLLIGWGAFNVVEGVVDHHLLGLHHVRDDVADPLLWDVGFLALSTLLLLGGVALAVRTGPPHGRASLLVG